VGGPNWRLAPKTASAESAIVHMRALPPFGAKVDQTSEELTMRVLQITEPLSQRDNTASLLARAQDLRAEARHVNPVLANAYLRRAAELRLAAWAGAARSAPLDIDDVLSPVAA
jgi:hypothetical protein